MVILKPESRELASLHDAKRKGQFAGSADRSIRGAYDPVGWFQVAGLLQETWEIFEAAYKEAYYGRAANN